MLKKSTLLIVLGLQLNTQFLYSQTTVATQQESIYYQIETKVLTMNIKETQKKVNAFISSNHIKVNKKISDLTDLELNMELNEDQFKIYESQLESWGSVIRNNTTKYDNTNEISETQLELEHLKKEKELQASFIPTMTSETAKDSYNNPIYKMNRLAEDILNKERELLKLKKQKNGYWVTLNIEDELSTPMNTRVRFVNMPGIEYSFLNIENPKAGLSHKNYNGYFAKYVFTRGKSYASIGVYKNTSKKDLQAYSDLFLVSFGQDFYSRYLGRGNRKFLNLYSGYSLGGLIASSDTKRTFNYFVAPSIGLELFKNKYVLIDSKINYFVPFYDNRNLRGLSFNTSFNFVF